MFTTLFQLVIASAILYPLWKLLQRFFIKSELDNIPGPPSRSFLFGDFLESESLIFESAFLLFTPSPGVFPQVFNTKGWEFHKDISEKCMNVFQFSSTNNVDVSQMVALSRLKPFLGFVLFLFEFPNWSWSQPCRKINFLSSTQKQCTT